MSSPPRRSSDTSLNAASGGPPGDVACHYVHPTSQSKIIFHYGVRSIPRPWSLVKSELNKHFGFPVVEKIEQANDYFRDKLHALLEAA